jgi:hypothetical protein
MTVIATATNTADEIGKNPIRTAMSIPKATARPIIKPIILRAFSIRNLHCGIFDRSQPEQNQVPAGKGSDD